MPQTRLSQAIRKGKARASRKERKEKRGKEAARSAEEANDKKNRAEWTKWLKEEDRLYELIERAEAHREHSLRIPQGGPGGSLNNCVYAINRNFPGVHARLRSEDVDHGDFAAPCVVTERWVEVTWDRPRST